MFGSRNRSLLAVVAALGLMGAATGTQGEQSMNTLTPIIFVDQIEPCLGFWEQLGFKKTMEVPGDDGLAFVGLNSGKVELMYQTNQSKAEDVPALAEVVIGPIALFIRVDDLSVVQSQLDGGGDDAEVIVIERKTFYGSLETIVRAPCGSIVTFAQFDEQ